MNLRAVLIALCLACTSCGGAASFSSLTDDPEIAAYEKNLLAHLRARSRGAVLAAGRGVVRLTLMPTGDVAQIQVHESSGIAELDAAAIEMVRNAAPFPEPPQRLRGADGVQLTIPFRFEPLRPRKTQAI